MIESDALEILKDAGVSIEGRRMAMPHRMYPKRVWRAFDYLVFECDYGFTFMAEDSQPITG